MSANIVNGHLTEADGRRLALDLLKDFVNHADRFSNRSIEAELREPGAAQDTESLRRYLDAYSSGPKPMQQGFLQVMSSMLDDWACGCFTPIDALEKAAQ